MNFRQLAPLVVALYFAAGAAGTFAGNDFAGSNVIKPFYYQGAGKTLTTNDQAQLAVYKEQLEVQQRAQQLRLYQGATRPKLPLAVSPVPANPAILSRNLFQTQSELNRVDSLLRTSHSAQFLPPTNPSGASRVPALGFTSFNPGMLSFPH